MHDRNSLTDNQFADRAWSDMSKLLDREMPVQQERKRRLLAWWWVFTGLVLGSVAFAGFLAWRAKTPPHTAPALPVATATKQADPLPPVLPSGSVVPPVAANAPETKLGQVDPTPPQPRVARDPWAGGRGSGTAASVLPAASVAQATPRVGVEALPSTTALPVAGNVQVPIAEPMPTPDLALLESTPGLPLPKEAKIPRLRKLDQAVFVGAMFDPLSHGSGLQAGFLASKRLKNSRLSIESGLAYAFVQQPLAINIGSDYRFNAGSANIGIDFKLADESFANADIYQVETNIVRVLNMHYLRMPLHLAYRLNDHWSAQAGLQASALLTVASNIASGGLLSSQAEDEALSVYDPSEPSADKTVDLATTVSSFDLAATVGFGYRLHQRLGLSVQYSHGMVDLLQKNTVSDKNHLLQFSLQYHLPNKRR